MSTVSEIESAIEKLSALQVEELALWLEAYRTRQGEPAAIEAWLKRSRGAALRG